MSLSLFLTAFTIAAKAVIKKENSRLSYSVIPSRFCCRAESIKLIGKQETETLSKLCHELNEAELRALSQK